MTKVYSIDNGKLVGLIAEGTKYALRATGFSNPNAGFADAYYNVVDRASGVGPDVNTWKGVDHVHSGLSSISSIELYMAVFELQDGELELSFQGICRPANKYASLTIKTNGSTAVRRSEIPLLYSRKNLTSLVDGKSFMLLYLSGLQFRVYFNVITDTSDEDYGDNIWIQIDNEMLPGEWTNDTTNFNIDGDIVYELSTGIDNISDVVDQVAQNTSDINSLQITTRRTEKRLDEVGIEGLIGV